MVPILERFSSPSLSAHSSRQGSSPHIFSHRKIALCAFSGCLNSISLLAVPLHFPGLAWILLHKEAGTF
jgi:hypothetical protein